MGKYQNWKSSGEIVAGFIEDETTINDRRHCDSDGVGNVILNISLMIHQVIIAMANSYASLCRQ